MATVSASSPLVHTPLPWHLGGTIYRRAGGNQWTVTSVWGPTPAGKQSGTWIAQDVSPADAEFIVRAVNNHAALLAACKAADVFIRNGIELGFIRMPDADVPDPAHRVPDMVSAAIQAAEGQE